MCIKTAQKTMKHTIMKIFTCCKPLRESAANKVIITHNQQCEYSKHILATSAYMITTVHSLITTQKNKMTSCTPLFTSVIMGQLHLIWRIYGFQSLPIQIVVIFAQLVPRTRTVTYGPRRFAVSGPTIWNILPSTLRVSATTLGQFQSGLKTILFRLAYGTWLGAFVTV